MHRFAFFTVCLAVAACGTSSSGDGGPDASTDGSTSDAGVDLGHDAGTDGGHDAGVDMSVPTCTSGCQIVDVELGFRHSCAMRQNGQVLCWGRNFWGELGDGAMLHPGEHCLLEGGMSIDCSKEPRIVGGVTDATALSVHDGPSSCARHMDGTWSCWGWGFDVPVGMGEPTIHNPSAVDPMLAGATNVGTSFVHDCQVRPDGTVQCMGSNGVGEIGNGTHTDTHMMVPVTGVTNAMTVSTSGHTCALISGGTIQCWGANASGELGDGAMHTACNDGTQMIDCSLTPVSVAVIDDAIAVDVGDGYSCAVRADHSLWCWGENDLGQLGQGDTMPRSMPTQVPGIANVAQLSAGSDDVCVVLMDGSVKCWGYNHHGTLGDGVTSHALCMSGEGLFDCSQTPVSVVEMGASGLTPITDGAKVAVGDQHACLLRASGEVFCWGQNIDHETGVDQGATTIDDVFVPGRVTIPM